MPDHDSAANDTPHRGASPSAAKMSFAAPQASHTREPAPHGRRVLVIGLDGATWTVLDPLMAEGRMPRLKEAVDGGSSGILRSTVPPLTPAAWTSFLTGKQPSGHGILDFERYDPRTHKLALNSTRCLDHVRSIWRILSNHGRKVGSINVPMTYPAIEVNGCMISGFETPGPDKLDFVYPPELREDIIQRWGDPTLRTNWRRKMFGGDRLFADNVAYMSQSFHQGAAMTRYCGDRYGWDVLMVVLKLVDNLQHKTWQYIDRRWCDRHPRRRDIVKACFAELDKAIGSLLDYAEHHDATVIMVSDHGHGSLEGKVHPNLLLKKWGYLTLLGGTAHSATRARKVWSHMVPRRKKRSMVGKLERELAMDPARTRAFIPHAGNAGFLYINLAGRQPAGIVPQSDYEPLRDELVARFLSDECSVRDPEGRRIPFFKAVHKPEEVYNCQREGHEWMPDLLLVPYDTLAVVRRIRGREPIYWLPRRRIEGTHREEGIFLAAGPGIKRGSHMDIDAHIIDCAPTILALAGLPIPDDMHGRVIADIFQTPPVIRQEPALAVSAAGTQRSDPEDAFSEEDLAKVTERLSDLGYLE